MNRTLRTRGIVTAGLAAIFVFFPAPSRAAELNPTDFAWRQAVIGEMATNGLYRARMTPETWDGLFRGPQTDLRVVGDGGQGWPFLVWREPGKSGTVDLPAERLNESEEVAGVRQFDLRLGVTEARSKHDRIRIEFREVEYMRRVEVLGRETDADAWARLGSGFLVRIPRSPAVREDVIAYAPSTFRHLRIRIHPDLRSAGDAVPSPVAVPGRSGGEPAPMDTCVMNPAKSSEPAPAADHEIRRQIVEFDAGASLPFEHIELRARGAYARDVTVWARASVTGEWTRAGFGRISRHPDAEYANVKVDAGRARYWKMEIRQGDDEALQDLEVTGSYPRTWIVFEARNTGPVHVWFGSEQAGPPHYDLAARTPRPGEAKILKLGPREANPSHQAVSRPPAWLVPTGVGLAALIVIGVILSQFKSLLRAPSTPPPSN